MNSFTIEGKCPSCKNDFEAVPTAWVGPLPSACTCSHCGANLSWPTNDGGIYLSKFVSDSKSFKEGEEPTFEVQITK
jgi:hypothetical protein